MLANCGGLRRSNHQPFYSTYLQQIMKTDHTYAAQMELTNVPEDSLKQWTNMPPISEQLYQELVKEFNNERLYFFNDSYNLED